MEKGDVSQETNRRCPARRTKRGQNYLVFKEVELLQHLTIRKQMNSVSTPCLSFLSKAVREISKQDWSPNSPDRKPMLNAFKPVQSVGLYESYLRVLEKNYVQVPERVKIVHY